MGRCGPHSRRGRICPALSIIGSCRQVIDLLKQIQNDRAEHHESYDVHGESPCGAGVARCASWSRDAAGRLQVGCYVMNCDQAHKLRDELQVTGVSSILWRDVLRGVQTVYGRPALTSNRRPRWTTVARWNLLILCASRARGVVRPRRRFARVSGQASASVYSPILSAR
jgi:hypothetical protein